MTTRPPRGRTSTATARPASSLERGVLDHPSHQLTERNARMGRDLGHQRGLGHAGLRVDFETEQTPRPLRGIVVAEIRTAHPPAPERTMGRKRQSSDLLVNIW